MGSREFSPTFSLNVNGVKRREKAISPARWRAQCHTHCATTALSSRSPKLGPTEIFIGLCD